MEKLFYDLSKNEFPKSRKILAWIFSGVFFLAGCGILYMNLVQQDHSIHITFSIPPFGISVFGALVAFMASVRRKDHYFLIDDEKIEYRFGLLRPVKHTFFWRDVTELLIPHKEKNIAVKDKSGDVTIISLTWLDKKKTHFIRKHFFYAGREKNVPVTKVNRLSTK